ncbi:MAG: hypothetical protein A2Y62_17180 [Candidatus Fischerbacteria bacterium RBG_13_37_8]|uniref:Sulfatase N-terminal domain-containing protein n=1 Tax=Candidatus Fischerbacteria bacterium RBG_13_37_8 TaxID=1817863 RepID=A0A1F5VHG0_9BACT|nr:MAG: hypothetical protein A2Y62_17180 [Candidatus Fischerbacteria bacterium RBG_13_37_8]
MGLLARADTCVCPYTRTCKESFLVELQRMQEYNEDMKNKIKIVFFTAFMLGLCEAILYNRVQDYVAKTFRESLLLSMREIIAAVVILSGICFALFFILEALSRLRQKENNSISFITVLLFIYAVSWSFSIQPQSKYFLLHPFSLSKLLLFFVAILLVGSFIGLFVIIKRLSRYSEWLYSRFADSIIVAALPLFCLSAIILSLAMMSGNPYSLLFNALAVAVIVITLTIAYAVKFIGRRLSGRIIIAFINLCALLFILYALSYSLKPPQNKEVISTETYPDILILSVDALRYDFVSAYGKMKGTTPHIDAIAQDGVLFEKAYSSSSWTLPALSSIMSAMYPSALGQLSARKNILPFLKLQVLPKVLSKNGYHTYFIVYPGMFGKKSNIESVFDHFIPVPDIPWYVKEFHELSIIRDWLPSKTLYQSNYQAEYLNKAFMEHLETIGEPFFVWMHYLDTHTPFTLPEIKDVAFLGKKLQYFSIIEARSGLTPISSAEKEMFRNYYRAEVEYADKMIGGIIEELKKRNKYENAMIIITADHGEEFWEHDNIAHGHSFYDEVMHIPLIIKFPQQKYKNFRCKISASLIDIAPTILSWNAIKQPYAYQGIDLMKALQFSEDFTKRAIFAENTLYYKERKAVINGDYKLILSDDGNLLFNLAEDPEEQNPINNPELRNEMIKLIANWQKQNANFRKSEGLEPTSGDNTSIDDFLRSLGYIR